MYKIMVYCARVRYDYPKVRLNLTHLFLCYTVIDTLNPIWTGLGLRSFFLVPADEVRQRIRGKLFLYESASHLALLIISLHCIIPGSLYCLDSLLRWTLEIRPGSKPRARAGSYGDWRDEFFKKGYTVIKGAIPRERADAYREIALAWFQKFPFGFDINDKGTWTDDKLPVMMKGGMILNYCAAHEKWVWEARRLVFQTPT